MREYFLPTIRLSTWTCLIVGWKCWPFCTRTIIGRKQGYKMREYVLPENSERKFGWKSVIILYHFFRMISSGIKKVAQKAQKNCFPLLRSGTKKYIICPNDDQQLWTSRIHTFRTESSEGMVTMQTIYIYTYFFIMLIEKIIWVHSAHHNIYRDIVLFSRSWMNCREKLAKKVEQWKDAPNVVGGKKMLPMDYPNFREKYVQPLTL